MSDKWLVETVDVFESKHFDWLDRYYSETDEPLDDETLSLAMDVVCDPFDAGLTLDQLDRQGQLAGLLIHQKDQ